MLPMVLVLSDLLVALLSWEVASLLCSLWDQGSLSAVSVFAFVPAVVLWLGIRAGFGLYGTGLDSSARGSWRKGEGSSSPSTLTRQPTASRR